MNFESFSKGNPTNKIEHPVLQRMHSEAQKIIMQGAIDPESFSDLYGKENIAADQRAVRNVKSKFENNTTKQVSDIFEALVLTHTELSNWLGPNTETIRTSEYDDIMNGVDLVLEFNEENTTKHLALGIDVTFGTSTMEKKFAHIKDEINKDELAKVKYFTAHGYKGSLNQLPRIVVGVDLDKIVQLTGMWERKENVKLADHITKDILISEIEMQLNAYKKYADSIGSVSASKSYTQAMHILRRVHTVRNGFSDDPTRLNQVKADKVYQEIERNLTRFVVKK